jgi:HSP20 family protein
MSSFFPIAKKKYYPHIQNDLNDIFDVFFPKWSDPVWSTPKVLDNPVYVSSPPCNIVKNNDGFELELAIPGYSRDDFAIDVEDDILTISMSKHHTDNICNRNYIAHEYDYNSFTRSWTLPEGAGFSSISAQYNAGILVINIPVENKETTKRRVVVE